MGRERSKTPILSRPRKPPEKIWLPATSLRLVHHVKLISSFWNTRSRKVRSRCPGGNGRMDIAEPELISRNLSTGMHVPPAQQQHQLVLCKRWIELRERHHV